MYQSVHAGWEQPAPQDSENSWQQGSSEQWQYGNLDYYQQQSYEKVSSSHQGERMSFSTRGYHDQPMGYHD